MLNARWAMAPTITSVIAADVGRTFTMNTWYISVLASFGDLFKAEPERYSKFVAAFQAQATVFMAVFPAVGARLAATRGLQRPPALAAGISLVLAALFSVALPETCEKHMRKPLTIRGSNPLNFLRLFTKGWKLFVLGVVEALQGLLDGRATFYISMVQRDEVFGWTMEERSRYTSFFFFMSSLAYALVAPLNRWLGPSGALMLGTGVNGVIQNLGHAL